MKFNLNEFVEQQELININLVKGTKNLSEAVVKIKEEAIDYLSKEVDNLQNELKKVETNVELLKSKNDELENSVMESQKIIDVLVNKTNTLEFNDSKKFRELKNKAHSVIMRFTGGKSEPEYILFFSGYLRDLYGTISNALCDGKRIGQIKIDDYDAALKIVQRWSPSEKLTKKIIKLYLDKIKNNTISELQSNALDLYLEKTSGGIN